MRKEVIAHKDPKSPISEVFRTLRTNIQFMSSSKKMKTLLVTSTFPGEGKSWVTSNLAVTFAQAGKRVILIDADMRKGRQYAIFGISPKPGLSNLLADMDEYSTEDQILDYVQQTEVENLYVITAGNVPPNPSELLVSMQMTTLLEKAKNLCDIVIVDGTPCELVTDSVILSRAVDTTIVVTAHKITKKDALQRVIKNIKNVGGNLAGVVINKVPVSAKKYGEKYYYYGHDANKEDSGRKKSSHIDSKQSYMKKTNAHKEDTYTTNHDTEELPRALQQNRISNLDTPMKTATKNETYNYREEKKSEAVSTNYKNNVSNDKTNDILNQINSYLEQEKK